MNVIILFVLAAMLPACGGSSGSESVVESQTSAPGVPLSNPTPEPIADPIVTEGNSEPESEFYNLGKTSQAVINQCMTDADKEMLTLVNNARSVPQKCGNQDFPVTTSLAWDCTLESVADGHNRDMGNTNFFNHTGSDGLTSAERVTNAGYIWRAVGENIAAGQPTVESVMTAWIDSPGHCSNIMNPAHTEMGAASYAVTGSDFSIYWTQNFAKPLN